VAVAAEQREIPGARALPARTLEQRRQVMDLDEPPTARPVCGGEVKAADLARQATVGREGLGLPAFDDRRACARAPRAAGPQLAVLDARVIAVNFLGGVRLGVERRLLGDRQPPDLAGRAADAIGVANSSSLTLR
jgi:hypothetical protein